MTCDYVERDLDLYIDRELDAEPEGNIRNHLRTCAECRQRVADRQAIGRLVRAMPYYEAPGRLRTRLAGHTQRTRAARRLLALAATAVIVVGISGGFSLLRPARWSLHEGLADATAGQVVDGHVRSLLAEHLFDVRSTDQHTVKPWFLGKLDFSPPVVDLAAKGFPLIGGRLDYVSGRPVAALVYQRNRHTINVFIWPADDGSRGMTARSLRGFHVYHWIRNGMSLWAVSDLNEAELGEFAGMLQAS